MSTPRVRFAPSPTGSLHVGGGRTALYNYLLAKQKGGAMVLRIEDTDQSRSTSEAMLAQLRDLQWLGLLWDEGPNPAVDYRTYNGDVEFIGAHGPYRQSLRLEYYQAAALALIDSGKAYYCFSEAPVVEEGAHPTPWVSPDRNLPLDEAKARIENGEKPVVRFRLPDNAEKMTFNDVVRGEVTLSTDMIGDFVLLRADGMPVYNFCCVVDDAAMQITHVLRGEEHLPNTLKQMVLYEALDKPAPIWGHLSIILGEDRKKLSKRQGAVSCDAFRAMGFLPEALLNYLALLGWSDATEQEIFTKEALIEAFSLERLNASPAVFDLEKLKWVNEQHLKAMSDEVLCQAIITHAKNIHQKDWVFDDAWWQAFMQSLKNRWQTLEDAHQMLLLLETPKTLSQDDIILLQNPESTQVLQAWENYLASVSDYPSIDQTKAFIKALGATLGIKGKALFMPLRLALIGLSEGVDVASVAALMSKAQLQARLVHCQNALGA